MSGETSGPDFPGHVLPREAPPAEGLRFVRDLREVAGERVRAVILFGSQLVKASPDRHSAWDLVVVVDRYRPFYAALHRTGHHERSPSVLTALARVLPPNVIAFFPEGPRGTVAKCMILDEHHFARALSARSPDHFVKGRMVQWVRVLFAADDRVRDRVEELLARARMEVLDWAGPYLDPPFDPGDLARTMLEVSYRGEVRPESGDRVREVFRVQEAVLRELYAHVLEAARARGRVVEVSAGRWRLAREPGLGDRIRVRAYFLRSKLRATARWFKHVATFNDWLTYIQRKVERRAGIEVEITPLERRFPYLFLWPKVFRVLASRPARRSGDEAEGSRREAEVGAGTARDAKGESRAE